MQETRDDGREGMTSYKQSKNEVHDDKSPGQIISTRKIYEF